MWSAGKCQGATGSVQLYEEVVWIAGKCHNARHVREVSAAVVKARSHHLVGGEWDRHRGCSLTVSASGDTLGLISFTNSSVYFGTILTSEGVMKVLNGYCCEKEALY